MPVRCATLPGSPVTKLSRQSTSQPSCSSRSHRCEPRKPGAAGHHRPPPPHRHRCLRSLRLRVLLPRQDPGKRSRAPADAVRTGRSRGPQRAAGLGERRVQRVPPGPRRRQPGRQPGRRRQHRVRRPRRRPRERRGGRRPDPLRVGAELLEDRPGQPEPGRLAGVGAVVDPGGAAGREPARPGRRRGRADQVGEPRWSSTTSTVSRLASSRTIVLTKLPPRRAVHPGGADHPGPLRQQLADRLLAGQLGPAVRRAPARSARPPRTGVGRVAGEDVVGGDVDQPGRRAARRPGPGGRRRRR